MALGTASIWILASCQAYSAGAATTTAGTSPAAIKSPAAPGAPVAGVIARPPTPLYGPGETLITAPSNQVVWVLINSAYLYRSEDRGATWEQRPLPPHIMLPPAISFVSESEGWLLTTGSPETQCNAESQVIWHTVDAGTTWQPLPGSGIAEAQCKENISFVNSRQGFLTAWDDNGRPTVYRSSDGGLTWAGTKLPDPPGFSTSGAGDALRAGLIRAFPGTLLVSAYGMSESGVQGFVFHSSDGGVTWTWLARLDSGVNSIAFVTGSRWLRIGNDSSGVETTDAGRTWHQFTTDYADAAGVASVFVFADDLVGYGSVRGGIQVTTDGGARWERITTPGIYQPG